jgi:hypothetical protein
MTQDMDASRIQVIHRLSESGFKPQMIDQILRMIDAMMTGRAPLAHVLVAAAEVCKVCELSRTHQHVANALACLAGEVLQYLDPPVEDQSGAPRRTPFGVAYWDHKRRGRVDQLQA